APIVRAASQAGFMRPTLANARDDHDRIGVLTTPIHPLDAHFGQIDIYLFDHLLRGRLTPDMRVFDAGCGGGRNLVYLLRNGFEVFAADASADAIGQVRQMGAPLAPGLPPSTF